MALIKDKIKQQNKEEYAYKKMLSYGWTPDQAAGIVGNLKYESGFNTSAEGDIGYKGGSSFGIAQFRGKRLDNLRQMYGSNWKDLDNQLDFVNWELNNTHKKVGDRLRNTQGIYNTGALISDKYEIPAKKFHQNKDRQKAVFSVYEKYSGVPLTDSDQQQFLKGTAQRAIDSYIPPTNEAPLAYTPEVSNLVSIIDIPTLAPENETEAVQKAKEELNSKQQQQNNQQRFIQDLLVASQVQYVDPNQVQQEDIYSQEQYFQRGGIYDLPMNNANPITPKQFTLEYLNSPKYRERLKNSGYEDVDGEIKRRLAGTNPEVFPYKAPPAPNVIQSLLGKKQEEGERGSYYSPFTKKIQLDSKYNIDTHRDVYPNATQPTSEEIETHERSHATTSLFPEDRFNKTDIRRLTNYHKKDKNIPEHDLIPGENKADLDAFRYLLKREGVYDAGKQDFTPEMFKRTKKSATKDRLQSVYSDEAIIYLMNNVAQNEDDNLVYGQNGGTIRDFYVNYLNSPNYKKRLNLQGYTNPNQTTKDRLNNIKKIDITYNKGMGSQYDPYSGDINIDRLELKQANLPIQSTIAHEYSHGAGSMMYGYNNIKDQDLALNVKELEKINEKNQYRKIDTSSSNKKLNIEEKINIDHDALAPEAKANIDALRYMLFKDKIYNTGNEEFNQKILEKAKKLYSKDEIINRNFKAFKDKDLIYLMNSIAKNEYQDDEIYAQNGGSIPISPNGVYEYPKQEVIVPTNSGLITMKNVDYPILGVDEYGNQQMMYPNQEYQFKGKIIHEIPQLKRNKRFS